MVNIKFLNRQKIAIGNDSDEQDKDGDTYHLEIGTHLKKHFLQILKINHVPTAGLQ